MIVFLIWMALTADCLAQNSELYIPTNIKKTYENKTRDIDGTPDPKYWQYKADYKMNIVFAPERWLLKSEAEVTYYNNSPDTLKEMYIHLYPNFYKKGHTRNFPLFYIIQNEANKNMR